jgi:hypothetical protein
MSLFHYDGKVRGDPRQAPPREEARVRHQLGVALLRPPQYHVQETLHAAEQDRLDVAAARTALKASQPALQPRRLVFIDETAVTTKMTRLYGRAPIGERLPAEVAHGYWKMLTRVSDVELERRGIPRGELHRCVFKVVTKDA